MILPGKTSTPNNDRLSYLFMHILFLFMDGIGLGPDDPSSNPFARANLPNLHTLLGGQRLLAGITPYHGERANLVALDACLGVDGVPQSATGQAVLLTGTNIPAALGYHYGPKPNPAVTKFLLHGNLFNHLQQAGLNVGSLNAYPPPYFEAIDSGRRMYSAIPLALASAGVPLKTAEDLYAGRALSVDFTGQGWRTRLGIPDAPVLDPWQAGQRLSHLAREYDFSFFEYWPSDYAGHGQDMAQACGLLETFDTVLGGLLEAWRDEDSLLLITSDHGNLEDLSTRRHTRNPAPALLVGAPELRRSFTQGLKDLTDVTPAILRLLA
jgi:2,3-bisphosphoglycerate-independent phosphoglycerate mutase